MCMHIRCVFVLDFVLNTCLLDTERGSRPRSIFWADRPLPSRGPCGGVCVVDVKVGASVATSPLAIAVIPHLDGMGRCGFVLACIHTYTHTQPYTHTPRTARITDCTACKSHFEITYEILNRLSNYRYKHDKIRFQFVAICGSWFESHLHYSFWLLLWSLSSLGGRVLP